MRLLLVTLVLALTGTLAVDLQPGSAPRAARPVALGAVKTVVRPKTVVMAAAIVALIGLMAIGLVLRTDAKMTVIHDRNPVAVMLSDGRVRNAYAVHLSNKADEARTFRLSVTGPADADVEITGGGMLVTVPADSTEEVRVLLKTRSRERQPVEFSAIDERTGRSIAATDIFIPPEGLR